MKIPENVSHLAFWQECKKKNIKINFRFVGVYLKISASGSPAWMARVQTKGKEKCKRFQFSEKGEIAASQFYIRYSK